MIYHLKEWLDGNQTIKREMTDDKGGTMRLGAYDATLSDGSYPELKSKPFAPHPLCADFTRAALKQSRLV